MAQMEKSVLLNRACGSPNIKFSVHKGEMQRPPSQAPISKARIVLFPEAISIVTGCRYATRLGIDGKWVGAACLGTYLSAGIDPGEHHICADLQQKPTAQHTALYELSVKQGKTYYFRAEIIDSNPYQANMAVHLERINEDEGLLLLSIRPAAQSKAK